MAAPFELPDICDIYRPFGSVDPEYTDVPCRIVPTFGLRPRNNQNVQQGIQWTHWVDFESDVDVIDNVGLVTTTSVLTFNPGDEIRTEFPSGITLILMVVFVEDRYTNTDNDYKRAWCVRYLRQ